MFDRTTERVAWAVTAGLGGLCVPSMSACNSHPAERTDFSIAPVSRADEPEKRLPLPTRSREGLSVLPVRYRPLFEENLTELFQGECPPDEQSFVDLYHDSMRSVGEERDEVLRTIQAALAFGAVPFGKIREAQEYAGKLLEIQRESTAPLDPALERVGLNVTWLNSANDPQPGGFSALEIERLKRTDVSWLPDGPTYLPFKLSTTIWKEASLGRTSLVPSQVNLDLRVTLHHPSRPDLALWEHQEHHRCELSPRSPKISHEVSLPPWPSQELDELRLSVRYSLTAQRPDISDAELDGSSSNLTHTGEVFLSLSPAIVEGRHLGYVATPLGLDNQLLRTPALIERSVLYTWRVVLGDSRGGMQSIALREREFRDLQRRLLNSALPKMNIITPGSEAGQRALSGSGYLADERSTTIDLQTGESVATLPFLSSTEDVQEVLSRGPTLLAFWATWCGPCIAGIPTLNQLSKEGGIQVVGVMDSSQPRSFERLRSLVETHRVSYPLVMVDLESAHSIGAERLPYYVLVEPRNDAHSGNGPTTFSVRWIGIGGLDLDHLKQVLKR